MNRPRDINSLALSVGEAVDALHLCDAEAMYVCDAMRARYHMQLMPDPVELLEYVDTIIKAAAGYALDLTE